jgi:hypothetical protein
MCSNVSLPGFSCPLSKFLQNGSLFCDRTWTSPEADPVCTIFQIHIVGNMMKCLFANFQALAMQIDTMAYHQRGNNMSDWGLQKFSCQSLIFIHELVATVAFG